MAEFLLGLSERFFWSFGIDSIVTLKERGRREVDQRQESMQSERTDKIGRRVRRGRMNKEKLKVSQRRLSLEFFVFAKLSIY
jgi:hypothetical protein